MNLNIDIALIFTVVLVTVRLSALFLLTPLFALTQIPMRIRIPLLLSLALFFVSTLPVIQITAPLTTGLVVLAIISEAIVGGLLAFGVLTAFAAFQFGGRIIDFQMGFGVATLIDPSTRAQAPMLGSILNMMAVITFFLIDGHHVLIRALGQSLLMLPPGTSIMHVGIAPIVTQFGVTFVFGIAVVAPVIVALLLVDVGLAVAARTMPQVNMFILGIPLKILVGLMVLAVSLSFMAPLLRRIYATIFDYWGALLA